MSNETQELTDKQRQFCEEYIIDLNGTKAAERAGYTPNSCHVEASRLLRNAKVAEYIDQLKAERSKRTRITVDDILFKLKNILYFDPFDVIDEYGQILDLDKIPPQYRSLIQGIKVKDGKDGREIEVKFMDRGKALDLMAKHLKFASDEIKITHEYSSVPDDELDAIIAERMKNLGK